MKFEVDGTTYFIRFRHGWYVVNHAVSRFERYTHFIGERPREARDMTECSIVESCPSVVVYPDRTVGIGYAYQHHKDAPNREIGRRVALKRAVVQAFSVDEETPFDSDREIALRESILRSRKAAWEAYLATRPARDKKTRALVDPLNTRIAELELEVSKRDVALAESATRLWRAIRGNAVASRMDPDQLQCTPESIAADLIQGAKTR